MQTKQQVASVAILTTMLVGLAVTSAFAQTDDYSTGTTSDTYCPQLFQTVVRGSSGNQVLELQKFLSDYYDIAPTTIQTSYFGRITQGYVIRFQKEQGLPSYGIAGTLTRKAIMRVCGGFSTNPTRRTPSITSLDAPAQLSVGQNGTWRVHVSDSSGYLSYSVVWGDEQNYGISPNTFSPVVVSSSGTFTHSYSHVGIFTPRFTVTNSSGQSANTSATVSITNKKGPTTISTIEDVNGFYGNDPAGTGKAGWIACSKPVQAKVTRDIYPADVDVTPSTGGGGPGIEPTDPAQVKANCVLQSEGLPLENDGKITVLQKPEVQALIAQYDYKNVHLRALKFDYILDKGFMERLLPIYKGRDIGCIIVLETPGTSKVYVEDEKLQTFEELDYQTFSKYLNQASAADKQLFLDNLH